MYIVKIAVFRPIKYGSKKGTADPKVKYSDPLGMFYKFFFMAFVFFFSKLTFVKEKCKNFEIFFMVMPVF